MVKTRKKGYVAEHELEQILRGTGLYAKRIPMSGQASHSGDMILKWGKNKCIAEVKSWARGFPEYDMLDHSDFVFKRTISNKGRKPWLVVMPLITFLSIVFGHEIASKEKT
jgi:hypothetical protein